MAVTGLRNSTSTSMLKSATARDVFEEQLHGSLLATAIWNGAGGIH